VSRRLVPGACLALLWGALPAQAQDPAPAAPAVSWDLYETNPAEPDFTLINLPTALRLPRHRLAFRINHRFARPLGEGDFGDLAGDFFGFDGGAQIGMGLRFGILDGTQFEVYRTSERSILFRLQQSLVQQGTAPVSLALLAGIEGRENFKEERSPTLGLVISRQLGGRGALYAVPRWVADARFGDDDESSLVLGLGARVRLGGSIYAVGEWHPRLAGVMERKDLLAFGIEKQLGGHLFQINLSNDLATTPTQIARGQLGPDDLYLGFNISRKFY